MTDIAWLIPRLGVGSGGLRTILQHAHALEKAGYCCHLYIEGNGKQSRASEFVESMFGYHFAHIYFGWDQVEPADMAIATVWYSAKIVRDLPFACPKAYLVQDYEPLFNPMGYAYLMAENSYRYGLVPITVGRWLKHVLASHFDLPAYHLDFGADTRTYRPLGDVEGERAVCFIYQPEKLRRCSRLGIEALGIVKHYMPEASIYLYGSPVGEERDVWFEHKNLGLLSLEECNRLYNRCAVGLCLSSSNPSRIPFEMMAAGLPVVDLWRENNLFDFPPEAVSLSEQTPESLAANIIRLLRDKQTLERMSKAGVKYIESRGLHSESVQFITVVEQILAEKLPVIEYLSQVYERPAVVADAQMCDLPEVLTRRFRRLPHARLNSLPAFIRQILGWGARKVRTYLIDQS
jgi:glycosyltransferase involved in cell wall biosynthesis